MIKANSLTPDVVAIIFNKSTEVPFSGEYEDLAMPGTYLCRNCGLALFRSEHKFNAACGWPSYDQGIEGSVKQQIDKDRRRTEIVCARCDAHLGHVFTGEGFTKLNTRFCVNSLSLDFVSNLEVLDTEEAILAAGCFWGVEYFFQKLSGVIKTEVGYIGGHKDNPTYSEVCRHITGHLEGIRVIYDPKKINYGEIIKYFFEIHDPTQINGQGPDLGEQYLSAIFYFNEEQQRIALDVIKTLQSQGIKFSTQLIPMSIFWKAEDYNQSYYAKNNQKPYCHIWQKKF